MHNKALFSLALLAAVPVFSAQAATTVWVDVTVDEQDRVLCAFVASDAPQNLAEAALTAARSRSYASVIERDIATIADRMALKRLITRDGALNGTVAVRFEASTSDPERYEATSMSLIGENGSEYIRRTIGFDVEIRGGRVIKSVPEDGHPEALVNVARVAMEEARFESPSIKTVLNTGIKVRLFLRENEAGDIDVVVGPIQRQVRPVEQVAPEYPKRALRQRVTGWTEVVYDVDSTGAAVNPRIVCADPEETFNQASLSAIENYRYLPDQVDGEAVPGYRMRKRMTFWIEP